ncbi:MAG: Ig-like domain-containing protein [Kouleothrix sp.]
MTGDGTVVASIPAGAAIDGAANLSAASTSSDNSVSYDSTAPSATINQAAGQADPTASSPVSFTVVFSEPVADFATGDVALSGSAGATTAVVTGGPTTYTVAVSGMTGDGTVIANLAAGVAHDAAGNANLAATSTDNSVLYDTVAPSVTINQAAGQADPTNASPIGYIVVFSEAVSGFATGDVTLDSPFGALTGAVSEIAPMNGTTYAVAVTGMAGSGTITATIAPGAATDLAGQPNRASSSTDNTVSFDDLRPNTTIDSNPLNPTSSTSASFSFTGADGSGVGIAGFGCSLDGGGFSACTSPQNYSSLADGSHTFQVRAIDAAGNIDPTPATFTWTIDTTAPTVALTSATSSPTNAAPILVSITFSEPVDIGTGVGDLSITNGSATTPVGSGTTYTFSLTPSGQGPVTAVYLAGSAFDAAGNPNLVSNTFSITYDTVAPSVTIEQAAAQPDPTSASPINFTVTFSEAVAGFSGANVTLGGTAGATTALVTGSGTTYNVAVSGMTGSGTVIATIPANAAQDAAGNTSTAATSTDNTVAFVYDPVAPVVASIARADASPSNAASVQFTVTFSKNVTGVDTSDFRLITSGVAGATITGVAGSGTTLTVTSATGSGDGTLRLDLIDDDTILDAEQPAGRHRREQRRFHQRRSLYNRQNRTAGRQLGCRQHHHQRRHDP